MLASVWAALPALAGLLMANAGHAQSGVETTTAPIFTQSTRCGAEAQAISITVDSMIMNEDASPDRVYAYIDAHTSQSCKDEKAAHVMAWKRWYNQATLAQRDAQAAKYGSSCSSAWPIACAYGF